MVSNRENQEFNGMRRKEGRKEGRKDKKDMNKILVLDDSI